MESDDPRVLGPMLFLLLVMPPPLMSAASFWPSVLSWSNLNGHLGQEWEGFSPRARYHRSEQEQDRYRVCDGKFDLYILMDTSDNMRGGWEELCKIVEEMVKKYTNPQLRMSFIASDGQVLMKPTADRKAIQDGISHLRNIVPSGKINMKNGFNKINELIQPVYKRDKKAASLIISMVGGMVPEDTLYGTRREVTKARSMGTKVYSVGLQDYSRRQLMHFVEGDYQIYGRDNYNTMDIFVKSLVENSCLDVMGEDTYFACVGESYVLGFFSPVLKEQNLKDYVCRYKLDNNTVYTLKATNMTKVKLLCQGHVFQKAGQVVVVDYSLDNGLTFQGKKSLKMTSRRCSNSTEPPDTTSLTNPPTHPTYRPTNPPSTKLTSLKTSRSPTLPPTKLTSLKTSRSPTLPPTKLPAPSTLTTTTIPPIKPSSLTTHRPSTPPPAKPPVPTKNKSPTSKPLQPPDLQSSPQPPPPIKPTDTHLYLVVFIPAMFMFPLLFCCIWRLCRKKTIKEPPPVLKPEKVPCPMQICPTVIVPWCGCQVDSMQRMEEKLDILCDFVQNYNHIPLVCCQHWKKGRCFDDTLVNPHCTQMSYGLMTCLGPNKDYFPLNSCCSWCQQHPQICSQFPSRMLPLIPPTARALCRTTLSLPPP